MCFAFICSSLYLSLAKKPFLGTCDSSSVLLFPNTSSIICSFSSLGSSPDDEFPLSDESFTTFSSIRSFSPTASDVPSAASVSSSRLSKNTFLIFLKKPSFCGFNFFLSSALIVCAWVSALFSLCSVSLSGELPNRSSIDALSDLTSSIISSRFIFISLFISSSESSELSSDVNFASAASSSGVLSRSASNLASASASRSGSLASLTAFSASSFSLACLAIVSGSL